MRLPRLPTSLAPIPLDHRIPYPEGPTNEDNLQPLCHKHHHLKHQPGWHLTRNPDGSYTWTTPTGHTLTHHPPGYE